MVNSLLNLFFKGNESIGEWEWKLGELKVRGRCAAMYGNEWMSDVCFVVGREGEKRVRIPAHKFILATASPVFYAMFYGPLAEKKEIEIIDIEPCIFHAMLKFVSQLIPLMFICFLSSDISTPTSWILI